MKPFEKYVKIEEEKYLKLLELEEENKKLNELVQFNVKTTSTLTKRINKAIQYIKENTRKTPFENYKYLQIDDEEIEELLKILKGV